MQLKTFKLAGTEKRIAINNESVQDVQDYYWWVNSAQKHFYVAGYTRITFRNSNAEDVYTELVEGTFEEVVRKLSPVTDFLTCLGL